ncbi:3-(3-hydroxy-phenyl)propionate 3-hydroxycinnamic acid hydroxylase [Hyphodiscus hymeniophilus]|uniref:3-(3-hydroxy-phenyl)propionate 3-hydroxycinnamic acid hydroxylase n=1 Tax=Hyphodiscus hymeniophilus TaxID=353542 RepID=A0A9P6SQP1_9HELO|nr:3-(3-hydroxy-phenyl)propionate 3-hydroxycinnamic acid hydroxylase [Hyphodiscus hymeniophilus]
MEVENTDVIICGCGPTGAMLSAYLGRRGVKNIVLERELDITQDPRGIALDEDGIRLLQGLGIYDDIFSKIGQKMGYFNFISGPNDLHRRPFLRFNYNTIEGGTGHPGFICHKQPLLEKSIRDVIEKELCSEIRSGSTVTDISEDDDCTFVTYTGIDGQPRSIRAKFFVGADGKTGFTRKRYLEPKGITMEKDDKFKYEEAWVALNWKLTPPTRETHPFLPLWDLGFTPEGVYNTFFPPDFRFICNPDRPSVCGRFGLHADRLWRFEYVVKPSEDGYEMAKYENVKKVVFPYLTLPKGRYGLEADVTFPEDCIEVIRSRPFTFSARSCNKWSLGRVILCGDAAHVFPPFGGQGIASGFRDAASLAWRLELACRPSHHKPNHNVLFEGWYKERKQQLEESLAATIVNGNFCNERSKVKTLLRNWYFWVLQLVPRWKHWLELGQRQGELTHYTHAPGLPFLPNMGGGRTFPQVFCAPYSSLTCNMRPLFTDDVIFGVGVTAKTGIFQLVVLLDSAAEVNGAAQDLAELYGIQTPYIKIHEATYLIAKADRRDVAEKKEVEGIWRLVDAGEYDADVWRGLPEPLGYDVRRLRREVRGRYVILRPDRFVFAACSTGRDLICAVNELNKILDT